MGPAGIEPAPLVLQTSVRTSYTKDPYSLRWYLPFLKSTLSPCLFYLSVLPYWEPEVNTFESFNTVILTNNSGQQWTRTTPVRTDFTDRLPYPNDFCYPIKLSRGEPIFHFLLDSYSLLTMVQSVTAREPNLIFVPRNRIELSPFACKTNTLPLRQRGWCYT